MGHYVALDTLYGSLKELSIEDLKGMLSDDPKVQSYFEANIPSVKEKQELVRQIKSQNIVSANENVEAKKALDRLEAEVAQLRKLVADRQAQIVPGASEIQEADSVHERERVLESLTADLDSCDEESRTFAASTSSETNWPKFFEEYVARRKAVHFKEALLERLAHE